MNNNTSKVEAPETNETDKLKAMEKLLEQDVQPIVVNKSKEILEEKKEQFTMLAGLIANKDFNVTDNDGNIIPVFVSVDVLCKALGESSLTASKQKRKGLVKNLRVALSKCLKTHNVRVKRTYTDKKGVHFHEFDEYKFVDEEIVDDTGHIVLKDGYVYDAFNTIVQVKPGLKVFITKELSDGFSTEKKDEYTKEVTYDKYVKDFDKELSDGVKVE